MRQNCVEKSEYVSWGVRNEKRIMLGETADLLTWENVEGSRRVKKITFHIVNETLCNFYYRSPIICAIFVHKNETLSEVSSTFSN